MSLPPGFLEDLQNRTSLSRIVGRKVTWDSRKTNQGKGDFWAPCPFHQEKTASFHVDDRKGFYYCFGCHAKGDAIAFVRETDNLDFMGAVRFLAAEAGMEVPEADPRAKAKADRRGQLVEVMEQAVQHYRLQFRQAAATQARDYLTSRGLDAAALERFEIGYAPDLRQGTYQFLKAKGVAQDLAVDAGLVALPDGGGPPYDRFRGRIIFPIRDGQGRAIALGGRSLDPDARAKYLNSPETELFDKSRTLYNIGPARSAVGRGQPLIVSEGYMDVIALVRAGFEGAVAPLGTAITEAQLQMMWRIHPEPVIALDGDTAGLRAAFRLIDLAMPMLAPDRALRFALLPSGKDPDDVIRSEGRARMAEIVDGAQPLLALLWQRETEARVLDSPERRAALDKSLRDVLARIADLSVRNHYTSEIMHLRGALLSGLRPARDFRKPFPRVAAPLSGTRNSLLVQTADAEERMREAAILATLLTHPALIPEFEGPLESVEFAGADHRALVGELLRLGPVPELKQRIAENLGPQIIDALFALRHVAISPGVRRVDDPEAARLCLAEEFAKLDARRGAAREVAEAAEDLEGVADEGVTWRLGQAAEARNKADRSQGKDNAEYDIAPSGARMNRDERKAFDALIDSITRGSETESG